MWYKLIWLAAGGALGTLARYGLAGLVQRLGGSFLNHGSEGLFPWGTLAVNVLGCFLFGLIWSMTEQGFRVDGHLRLAVFTGFLGAFTTFSTYAFESGQMFRDSQWLLLAGNVMAQNGLGLVAVLLGFAIGKV